MFTLSFLGKKLRSSNENLQWPFVNIFYSFPVWTSRSALELFVLFQSQHLKCLVRSVISDPSFQGNFEHLHSFHQYISETVRARTQVSLTSLYLLNYLIFPSTVYVTELCKTNANIANLFLLHFIKTFLFF